MSVDFEFAYAEALNKGFTPTEMLATVEANIRVHRSMIETALARRHHSVGGTFERRWAREHIAKLREARAWRNRLIARMAVI